MMSRWVHWPQCMHPARTRLLSPFGHDAVARMQNPDIATESLGPGRSFLCNATSEKTICSCSSTCRRMVDPSHEVETRAITCSVCHAQGQALGSGFLKRESSSKHGTSPRFACRWKWGKTNDCIFMLASGTAGGLTCSSKVSLAASSRAAPLLLSVPWCPAMYVVSQCFTILSSGFPPAWVLVPVEAASVAEAR